jgi:hypothetical protein
MLPLAEMVRPRAIITVPKMTVKRMLVRSAMGREAEDRHQGDRIDGQGIVIVGGAVGGYTGAHMAQAGEDVTFIDFWPEHVER